MIGSAYYDDTFRRENGRWKFVEHKNTFFHFVPIQQGWATADCGVYRQSRFFQFQSYMEE